METKNNSRYFHRSFRLLYYGVPMAAVGAAVVFGKFFRRYNTIENAFTVLMAIGVLLILFFFVSAPRDSEYDRGIRRALADIRAEAEAKITALEHTPHFMENYLAEGFVYGEGTSELKRGSDGIFRTDIYSASQLIITLKRLYVYTVSLDTGSGEKKESFEPIAFDSIRSVSVKEDLFELTYKEKHGAIRRAFFCIVTDEAELMMPTHNDALADNMASRIMIRAEEKK